MELEWVQLRICFKKYICTDRWVMVMNTLYLNLCGPKNSAYQCSMTLVVGFGWSCRSATVEIAKQHFPVVVWHSVASVRTTLKMREYVHWLELYEWTRVFRSLSESNSSCPTHVHVHAFLKRCTLRLSCTPDHMHSQLMMMDLMRALHLQPCKNCKSIYQPTLCYLVFYYFSHAKYICEDPLTHFPFVFLWYCAASVRTGSQIRQWVDWLELYKWTGVLWN